MKEIRNSFEQRISGVAGESKRRERQDVTVRADHVTQ